MGQGVAALDSGADGNENRVVDSGDRQVWASNHSRSGTVPTGLLHPFRPNGGDTWYFNIGQVSSAGPMTR